MAMQTCIKCGKQEEHDFFNNLAWDILEIDVKNEPEENWVCYECSHKKTPEQMEMYALANKTPIQEIHLDCDDFASVLKNSGIEEYKVVEVYLDHNMYYFKNKNGEPMVAHEYGGQYSSDGYFAEIKIYKAE